LTDGRLESESSVKIAMYTLRFYSKCGVDFIPVGVPPVTLKPGFKPQNV